jgi:hypothetical protein
MFFSSLGVTVTGPRIKTSSELLIDFCGDCATIVSASGPSSIAAVHA